MIKVTTAILLLGCLLTAQAGDLQTILDRNAEAHGAGAIAGVDAVEIRLHITEPTFEVQGTYVASRAGRMRIDIYAGGDRVFAEGLAGDCAWEWVPGRPAAEAGQCVGEMETRALRHGIEMPGHFYTLRDLHARGEKVELIGEAESAAGSEWRVRVTLADGFSRDYFIDRKTFRITRARDFRAFHPGVDPTQVNIETRYEAPEVVGGALRFRRQVNVNADTGETLGTTEIRSIKVNPNVSDEMFNAAWVPAT